MKYLAIVFVALLGFAGCSKDEPAAAKTSQPEKAAEAPKEAAKPAATPAAAVAAADDDIPTEADFDQESEKDITTDSVDKEVDALAKEIGE